jgi:hypothetical protein
MLDPHSGSEYGAARIAAMIAATITIILTGLVSFGFMVPYAQADSFGTLTINAVWNRDAASPKSLAGDTYAIVRVATVTTNSNGSVSSYKTVSDFSGLTADWERLTSSEYHDAAKKLAAHAAKNKLYQHSGTTNAAGQLTFQNLPHGTGRGRGSGRGNRAAGRPQTRSAHPITRLPAVARRRGNQCNQLEPAPTGTGAVQRKEQ